MYQQNYNLVLYSLHVRRPLPYFKVTAASNSWNWKGNTFCHKTVRVVCINWKWKHEQRNPGRQLIMPWFYNSRDTLHQKETFKEGMVLARTRFGRICFNSSLFSESIGKRKETCNIVLACALDIFLSHWCFFYWINAPQWCAWRGKKMKKSHWCFYRHN